MSRDPLEGYRPSDTASPSFTPAQPVPAHAPAPSWAAARGAQTKVIVLVIVAAGIAMVAGFVAYFLTVPGGSAPPKGAPAGEMTVKQGPPPPDAPSPAPSGTPR